MYIYIYVHVQFSALGYEYRIPIGRFISRLHKEIRGFTVSILAVFSSIMK
jgi:hypothetical protein